MDSARMDQKSEDRQNAAMALLLLSIPSSKPNPLTEDSHYPETGPSHGSCIIGISTMADLIAFNKQRQEANRESAESSAPTTSNSKSPTTPDEQQSSTNHTSPITPPPSFNNLETPQDSTENKLEALFTEIDAALVLCSMRAASMSEDSGADSELLQVSEFKAQFTHPSNNLAGYEQQKKFWDARSSNELNTTKMNATNFILSRDWYPVTQKTIVKVSDEFDETESENGNTIPESRPANTHERPSLPLLAPAVSRTGKKIRRKRQSKDLDDTSDENPPPKRTRTRNNIIPAKRLGSVHNS